jgi:hypothetical protein
MSQSEMGDLLVEVEDDECAEVFFVEKFSPSALFGGGVTFGSGTAEAKVVSSDENAYDIDFTHLAHELGHVMGLTHPGDGNPSSLRPEVTDGSSGTLMCPSGFMNEHPDINSNENSDNLSSPLFTYILQSGTDIGDCEASADCGACP